MFPIGTIQQQSLSGQGFPPDTVIISDTFPNANETVITSRSPVTNLPGESWVKHNVIRTGNVVDYNGRSNILSGAGAAYTIETLQSEIRIDIYLYSGSDSVPNGVMFRYVDDSNYWYAIAGQTFIRIVEVTAGTPTTRAERTDITKYDAYDPFHLIDDGIDITWSHDHPTTPKLITYASSTHYGSTLHGLYSISNNSWFCDSFKVTALSHDPLFVSATTLAFPEGSSANRQLPKPAGIREGDLLVAMIITRNSNPPAYPNGDSNWTEHYYWRVNSSGVLTDPAAGDEKIKLWSRVATASEPANYEFQMTDLGTDSQAIGVAAFRNVSGISTPSPHGSSPVQADSQNCLTIGDILICYHATSLGSFDTGATPAGMTLIDKVRDPDERAGMAWAYEIRTATGATGARAFGTPWNAYECWCSFMVEA